MLRSAHAPCAIVALPAAEGRRLSAVPLTAVPSLPKNTKKHYRARPLTSSFAAVGLRMVQVRCGRNGAVFELGDAGARAGGCRRDPRPSRPLMLMVGSFVPEASRRPPHAARCGSPPATAVRRTLTRQPTGHGTHGWGLSRASLPHISRSLSLSLSGLRPCSAGCGSQRRWAG